MNREQTFIFEFDVSNDFLRASPVAERFVEIGKARIAARRSIRGPRGGLYRLITPPDKWRAEDQGRSFIRDVTIYWTRRDGRYVRPDRITPDLLLSDEVHFDSLTVPAAGPVVLPSGATIQSTSPFVSFPVLVP